MQLILEIMLICAFLFSDWSKLDDTKPLDLLDLWFSLIDTGRQPPTDFPHIANGFSNVDLVSKKRLKGLEWDASILRSVVGIGCAESNSCHNDALTTMAPFGSEFCAKFVNGSVDRFYREIR